MREHLYKAKRIDNGEWAEGSLIKMDASGSQSFIFPPYEGSSSLSCGTLVAFSMVAVDPETVCEYTGMVDKNGAKIFESDTIRVEFEADRMPESAPETWSETYEVVFSDHYHAWYTKLDDGDLGEWLYEYDGDCEVIGNIHSKAQKGGVSDHI